MISIFRNIYSNKCLDEDGLKDSKYLWKALFVWSALRIAAKSIQAKSLIYNLERNVKVLQIYWVGCQKT